MLSPGSASHPATGPTAHARPRIESLRQGREPTRRRRRRHREPAKRPGRRAEPEAPSPRPAPRVCCAQRELPRGKPSRPHTDSRESSRSRETSMAAFVTSGAMKRPQPHKVAVSVAGTEASHRRRLHRLHCRNYELPNHASAIGKARREKQPADQLGQPSPLPRPSHTCSRLAPYNIAAFPPFAKLLRMDLKNLRVPPLQMPLQPQPP